MAAAGPVNPKGAEVKRHVNSGTPEPTEKGIFRWWTLENIVESRVDSIVRDVVGGVVDVLVGSRVDGTMDQLERLTHASLMNCETPDINGYGITSFSEALTNRDRPDDKRLRGGSPSKC
jgi:hypothetical protein